MGAHLQPAAPSLKALGWHGFLTQERNGFAAPIHLLEAAPTLGPKVSAEDGAMANETVLGGEVLGKPRVLTRAGN